jgi:transcriptional regulator with XRE-family HTH domain
VPTNADLGHAIRRLRWDRHLTIEALGHAADIHPTYVSGIERGVRNPTWSKITSLAGALDVSVSEVIQTAEQEAEIALIVRDARARTLRGEQPVFLDAIQHRPEHRRG